MGKTLAEKVWDEHVVRSAAGEPDLLFIDLHLIHEVTSPQAFDGLRLAGRPVRRMALPGTTRSRPDLEHRPPFAVRRVPCHERPHARAAGWVEVRRNRGPRPAPASTSAFRIAEAVQPRGGAQVSEV